MDSHFIHLGVSIYLMVTPVVDNSLHEIKHGLVNSSGGQMRRASLAVSLVHEPELLILDEPTVGLDPVLRHSIWEHLTYLAAQGTTIIITTHYIEEARQAHAVSADHFR